MNVPSEWPSCSTMGAPFDVRIGAFSQSYRAASTEQFFSARPHLEIFFFSAALSLYFFLKILQNYKCGTTLCIILVYIDTRKYWDPISDEPSEWPSCSTLGAPFEVRIEAFDRPYPAASIDIFFFSWAISMPPKSSRDRGHIFFSART